MIEDHRVFDMVDHLAMVVDDHDGRRPLIERRPFQHIGIVGIGDDQQGAAVDER